MYLVVYNDSNNHCLILEECSEISYKIGYRNFIYLISFLVKDLLNFQIKFLSIIKNLLVSCF